MYDVTSVEGLLTQLYAQECTVCIMPYSIRASQNKHYSTPPSMAGSESFVADGPCSDASHVCNRTVEKSPLEKNRLPVQNRLILVITVYTELLLSPFPFRTPVTFLQILHDFLPGESLVEIGKGEWSYSRV